MKPIEICYPWPIWFCLIHARYGGEGPVLQLPNDGDPPPPFVRCTQHMCPIQIHWHVKVSYREYWRVKVTLTNYNLVHNYSEWNLVVNHPNFESLTQVFSFEHEPLRNYGPISKPSSSYKRIRISFFRILFEIGDLRA